MNFNIDKSLTMSLPTYPEPFDDFDGRWDATSFFYRLTKTNCLAQSHGFRFRTCSDLQGFGDTLSDVSTQNDKAIVCVSDTSDGVVNIAGSPSIRQVKTVFMAMRHTITTDAAAARQRCYEIMREIFRQFMTVLSKEAVQIRQGGLYIDERVSFSEISKYFFTGCACAFFQISITRYCNLIYRPEEWQQLQ